MSRKLPKETLCMIAAITILTFIPIPSSAAPAIQTRQKTIVLDPGHGGTDTGLANSTGLTEKQVCLNLARKVSKHLSGQYQIHMTRQDDRFLPFAARTAFANQTRADLFISFHLHNSDQPSGFIYYSSLSPNKQNEDHTIWHLAGLPQQSGSQSAATHIRNILNQKSISKNVIISGAFLPLEGCLMPALLLEPFSITNLPPSLKERKEFLSRMSRRIADGITHLMNGE